MTDSIKAAKVLVHFGLISDSLRGQIERAEKGHPEAIERIDEALDEYIFAGNGEDESAAELITDAPLRSLGREAALHGTFDKFLSDWGITGSSLQMSLGGKELEKRLIGKYNLSSSVLRGMARAADVTTRKEDDAMMVVSILVSVYNDILSKVLPTQYGPSLSRALLDEFFSKSSFLALRWLRSLGAAKKREQADSERLAIVAVNILVKLYGARAKDIARSFETIRLRLTSNPNYFMYSKGDLEELAHYASLDTSIAAGKNTNDIGAAFMAIDNRERVESEFDGTLFQKSAREISRAVQFSEGRGDALRRAGLLMEDARKLAATLPDSIDREVAHRLAAAAICHSLRTGEGDVEGLFEGMTKTFLSLQESLAGRDFSDLSLEVALRMSLLPDDEKTVRSFAQSKKIFMHVRGDLATATLEDQELNSILRAIVNEIPLEHLEDLTETESLRNAVDIASNAAGRMARITVERSIDASTGTPLPRPKGASRIPHPPAQTSGVEFAPPVRRSEAAKPSRTTPQSGRRPVTPPRKSPGRRLPRPGRVIGAPAPGKGKQGSAPPVPKPGPRPQSSIPPPSPLEEFRTNMSRDLNWSDRLIESAAKWILDGGEDSSRRTHLLAILKIATFSLSRRARVMPAAAFTMLEERVLEEGEPFFALMEGIPQGDDEEIQRAVEGIAENLTDDAMDNMVYDFETMGIWVALRLSDHMGIGGAIRMATVSAPRIRDDVDLERVIENFEAANETLAESWFGEVSDIAASALRLYGSEESAIASAEVYSKQLATLRMQEGFRDLAPGRMVEIFNIALDRAFEYKKAKATAKGIVKKYGKAVKEYLADGLGDEAEAVALVAASSTRPDEAAAFMGSAFSSAARYYSKLELRQDIAQRLATAACAAIGREETLLAYDPAFVAGTFAVDSLEKYRDMVFELKEGGIEHEEAIEGAIELLGVANDELRGLLIARRIEKRWEDDGGGKGSDSGGQASTSGNGSTPPAAPSDPGAQKAQAAFDGAMRVADPDLPLTTLGDVSEPILDAPTESPETLGADYGISIYALGAHLGISPGYAMP